MPDSVLSQGVGYGVVCGLGIFFSVIMLGITYIQGRYTSHKAGNAEEFSSASRTVKPGLIATGIVSAWTWAATLLQSSAVGYRYGISGPFWYGSAATVQILLFSMLASRLKKNAPYAHTFLEIIACRWGTPAHLVFLVYGMLTNPIVSAMLVTGGSATVSDLTGMSTQAAVFLIPAGVALYVFIGGMRATLFADWAHTAILFILLITFFFTTYATSPQIGSPAKMYELLKSAALRDPVSGNAQGSYVTMRSTGGLIFGILNLIVNCATVFADQAYWQRAVASKPQTAVKAFLIGGICWFSIPFCLATTLGLAARALGIELTSSEISAGLPAPQAAAALMGKGGAGAMLLLLFMAVTSATSAEQVAVSSVITFDVYSRYINPQATEAQILRVSHFSVAGFALVMGTLGLALFYAGIGMGWLYTAMGVWIGCAVVPIALAVTWRKANKWGCICGTVGGFILGLTAWLVTTATLNNGVLTVPTTGQDYPLLAGALTSIGVGGIVSIIWSLIDPENFDFESTRAMNTPTPSSVDIAPSGQVSPNTTTPDGEKDVPQSDIQELRIEREEIDFKGLDKTFVFAAWSSVTLFCILIILVPLPLFGTSYVFSEKSFAAWVGISIAWAIMASVVIVCYPLWESRRGLSKIGRGIWLDVMKEGMGKYVGK